MNLHDIGFALKLFKECLTDIAETSRQKKIMNSRAAANRMYNPTKYEHCANTASHAVMIVPSILAGEFLIWKSEQRRNILEHSCLHTEEQETFVCQANVTSPTHAEIEFSSRAYGIALTSLFLVSVLYHWIAWTQSLWKGRHEGCAIRRPSLNKQFHYCDRITIYFFIAGSYSPWLTLREIHPNIAWLQWGVWLFAICGTAYSIAFLEKYKLLDTILYVMVALLPGLAMVFYTGDSNAAGMPELALGGAFYLAGVLIFKCDGLIPFAHAIWHLFVACGAFAHFSGVSQLYTPKELLQHK